MIQHTKTKQLYFGKTNNLKRRIKEHNSGAQKSTRRIESEWKFVYAEMYRSKKDADIRESKIKQHGSNKRWLKERIKHSMLED